MKINLKGVAIGNGLVNPEVQYPAYADFALQNDLIDQAFYDKMTSVYPTCDKLIKACKFSKLACTAAVIECQATVVSPILAEASRTKFGGEPLLPLLPFFLRFPHPLTLSSTVGNTHMHTAHVLVCSPSALISHWSARR
jgi:hypothetical protein